LKKEIALVCQAIPFPGLVIVFNKLFIEFNETQAPTVSSGFFVGGYSNNSR